MSSTKDCFLISPFCTQSPFLDHISLIIPQEGPLWKQGLSSNWTLDYGKKVTLTFLMLSLPFLSLVIFRIILYLFACKFCVDVNLFTFVFFCVNCNLILWQKYAYIHIYDLITLLQYILSTVGIWLKSVRIRIEYTLF